MEQEIESFVKEHNCEAIGKFLSITKEFNVIKPKSTIQILHLYKLLLAGQQLSRLWNS